MREGVSQDGRPAQLGIARRHAAAICNRQSHLRSLIERAAHAAAAAV